MGETGTGAGRAPALLRLPPRLQDAGHPADAPSTLVKAREIALKAGLRYVYTGNVHNREGDTTFCPGCHEALIVRDWYEIIDYRLTADGHCPTCNSAIAGRFEAYGGAFGARRIPVAIHRHQAGRASL